MYKDTYNIEYFGEAVVNATAKLISEIWQSSSVPIPKKIKAVEKWLKKVCDYYGIDVPEFIFSNDALSHRMYNLTGGGMCVDAQTIRNVDNSMEIPPLIILYKKISVTTLLHEFRHHMQNQLTWITEAEGYDKEEDAKAWSCSLYYVTDPQRFMRAYEAGKLFYA